MRTVRGGELLSLGYGAISSMHVDPVEKKPLYHFYPGTPIFSVGGWGCNFRCAFCQNWAISQRDGAGSHDRCLPAAIVRLAMEKGCKQIAYTYNEPLIGFEFVRDCARLAREAGLRNVLVTNGYVEVEPAKELLPFINALNVDIKSMSDRFYREQCHGSLAPVLRFCCQAAEAGCHLEITNLIIPTLNDHPDDLTRLAAWIKEHLGMMVPLHLNAYHPDYRMNIESTSGDVLERAWHVCRRELAYVYMGNVASREGQTTLCPQCGHQLILRQGYTVEVTGLRHGSCAQCGRKADVVT
jgi:pyruvate formate lyase activating enzyme